MLLVALSRRMCCSRVCKARRYADRAVRRGILNKRAENCAIEFQSRVIAYLDFDPERLRARLKDGNGLWMTMSVNKKRPSVRKDRVTKRHRFSSRRCFVQHRSI